MGVAHDRPARTRQGRDSRSAQAASPTGDDDDDAIRVPRIAWGTQFTDPHREHQGEGGEFAEDSRDAASAWL